MQALLNYNKTGKDLQDWKFWLFPNTDGNFSITIMKNTQGLGFSFTKEEAEEMARAILEYKAPE